jgi:ribosomal protein S18 acetylase RimI-like enzyme
MKRLYVKPDCRKNNAGQLLVDEIIEFARQDGYSEMVLDTIKPLQSAIRLYKKVGFTETEPYYDNPMNDVIYFRKQL